MSYALTKPVWPEATTCVTVVGPEISQCYTLANAVFWHDKAPAFWTCTKSQHVWSQSHNGIKSPHLCVLLPQLHYFHPCFCQKAMIKCTHWDLFISNVPYWCLFLTPSRSHIPVFLYPSCNIGHKWSNFFLDKKNDIWTSKLFERELIKNKHHKQ